MPHPPPADGWGMTRTRILSALAAAAVLAGLTAAPATAAPLDTGRTRVATATVDAGYKWIKAPTKVRSHVITYFVNITGGTPQWRAWSCGTARAGHPVRTYIKWTGQTVLVCEVPWYHGH